ncbi:MAG: SUMF1/EgtB/PvdO family nonheme iron enzyme [Anaerolineae bacterium]|nr:SUMF1/EgtB/PvdO family nonheme iron enzyme [Anaerolineae bacterium]
MTSQKPTLFISYRRADHPDFVERIRDWFIANGYDDARVFMDLSNMPYFTDFAEFIREKVLESEVVLVIIGPQWLEHLRERAARDETDYVRLEIAIALEQGKLVAPICIKGAKMPNGKDLQDFPDLKQMTRYHAPELDSGRPFLKNIADIIGALEAELERRNSKKMIPSNPKKIQVWDVLPQPFEWCEIPAGKVTLEDASSDGGTKGGTFEIPAFLMAKYPITNAQYEVFLASKDGYWDVKWWNYSEEARQWRAEHKTPREVGFSGNDLPRTNVSWYDTVAFCRWLSNRTGQKIMLPTEQQWQRGAQGDDGRKYPWGNQKPDKTLCNFGSNVGQTTPVTQYPKGISPFGVMDMSGNVWEWCMTEWGTNSDDRTDKYRSVRGGSFGNYINFLCSSYRIGGLPVNEVNGIGLRCVHLL